MDITQNTDSKPICDTCKRLINEALPDFEKFAYKTIDGKIKEVWCCLDCQMNILMEEVVNG